MNVTMKTINVFIFAIIGLLIALLIFVYVFPEIAAGLNLLASNGNLSGAEKSLLSIIGIVIVAGVLIWIWKIVSGSNSSR